MIFAKETPISISNDVDELYFEWYSIADVEESMLPNSREYLVDESCFWDNLFERMILITSKRSLGFQSDF